MREVEVKEFHVAGTTFLFSWADGVNNDLSGFFEFRQGAPVSFLHLASKSMKLAYVIARSESEMAAWRDKALELGYKEIIV